MGHNVLANLPALNSFELHFLNECQIAFNDKPFGFIMKCGFGNMINECLCDSRNHGVSAFTNILLLVNEILPMLPSCLEFEKQCTNPEFPKSCFMISEDKNAIEHLSSEIANTIICIFSDQMLRSKSIYFNSVFLKILYFAKEEKLTKIISNYENKLLTSITDFLRPMCMENNKVGVMALMILAEKIPRDCLNKLLTTENIIHLKRLCKTSLELKFYETLKFDEILNKEIREWSSLQKICKQLEVGIILEATESLTIILDKVDVELIYTDLICTLNRCIGDFRKQSKIDMKTFLRIFLKFSSKDGIHYDVKTFTRLVEIIQSAFSLVYDSWIEAPIHSCPSCPHDWFGKYYYTDYLTQISSLLEHLYILSETWFQWFGLCSSPALVKLEKFNLKSEMMNSLEKNHKNLFNYLIKICPAMIPYLIRKGNFDKSCQLKTIKLKNHHYLLPLNRKGVLELFLTESKQMTRSYFLYEWTLTFKGEEGGGTGVFKEFLTLIAKEFQGHQLNLWYGNPIKNNESGENDILQYTYSPNGLFPKFNSTNNLFTYYCLGQLIAKCFLEGFPLALPLDTIFFKYLIPGRYDKIIPKYFDFTKISQDSSKFIEQLLKIKNIKSDIMADNSLTKEDIQKKIGNLKFDDDCTFDDLCINFTVPGSGEEMVTNGAEILLDPFNVEIYLDYLGQIVELSEKTNIAEIRRGFEFVLPGKLQELSIFLPEELQSLICGKSNEEWTIDYLKSALLFSEGYRLGSAQANYLLTILSSFNATEQRLFLQFVTGIPSLPCGGLKNLSPNITVIRVKNTDRLPSAYTCTNTLVLPPYHSLKITKEKLYVAMKEGRGIIAIA